MKKVLMQYTPFIATLLWMEVNTILIEQWHYGTQNLIIYSCLATLATIVMSVCMLLYLSKCHNQKDSCWPIFSQNSIYFTTIIVYLVYVMLALMGGWGSYLIDREIHTIFSLPKLRIWLITRGSVWLGILYMSHIVVRDIHILWVIAIGIAQHYQVEQKSKDIQDTILLKEYEQRIQLSLQVREKVINLHDEGLLSLPGVICSEAQWDEFLTEYDLCHHGLLNKLRAENPKLTDMDMIYLILCSMGYTPHDISLLLDTTDRTVWNRRQLVKEHLDGDIADLDEWIKEKL